MTCRYSSVDWRDVLYNSVRNTPGGVADAAQFLTTRRSKTIHPESLRTRLRHVDGESISLEMIELLTEWMREKAQAGALDWLDALNGQYDRVVSRGTVQEEQRASLQTRGLELARYVGDLAGKVADAQADGIITRDESDKIAAAGRELMRATLGLMSSADAEAKR